MLFSTSLTSCQGAEPFPHRGHNVSPARAKMIPCASSKLHPRTKYQIQIEIDAFVLSQLTGQKVK
jgi:hypothetical protein